jgi:hypothetical protein
MEFTSNYAALALTAVAGKFAFNSARYWWNKKSLKQIYIAKASVEQLVHEQNDATDDTVDVVELLSKKAIGRAVKHKGVFRNYLVQTGKAKFGCPTRNEANRLVVRKFIYDLCTDHGLIARHINDHIDVATELVFIPSREQLTALAMAHTELSKVRLGVSDDLGGPRATIA